MSNPGLISILAAGNETFRKLNAGVLANLEHEAMAKLPKARKSKGNIAVTYAYPITDSSSLATGIPAQEPKPHKRAPLLHDKEIPAGSAARPCVIITRCSSGHLDRDNCVASVKGIVDALRYAGYISGDTEDHIDLYVFQKKVKRKDAGTLIEIVQLGSASGCPR